MPDLIFRRVKRLVVGMSASFPALILVLALDQDSGGAKVGDFLVAAAQPITQDFVVVLSERWRFERQGSRNLREPQRHPRNIEFARDGIFDRADRAARA